MDTVLDVLSELENYAITKEALEVRYTHGSFTLWPRVP